MAAMTDVMEVLSDIVLELDSKGKNKADICVNEVFVEDEKHCGLFSLPTEIIQHLLSFLPSSHSALQVALCSKACYALALPAIYSHIN